MRPPTPPRKPPPAPPSIPPCAIAALRKPIFAPQTREHRCSVNLRVAGRAASKHNQKAPCTWGTAVFCKPRNAPPVVGRDAWCKIARQSWLRIPPQVAPQCERARATPIAPPAVVPVRDQVREQVQALQVLVPARARLSAVAPPSTPAGSNR